MTRTVEQPGNGPAQGRDWAAFRAAAPEVIDANTYFWRGFFGNAKSRARQAEKLAAQFEAWLLTAFPREAIRRDGGDVYLYDELVFSIHSSARNVYKKQNLRYIKKRYEQR